MTSSPRAVVDTYLAALEAFDFEHVRATLADREFRYVSPIAGFEDADEYVRYVTFSSSIILKRQIRKVFADDDDVCHIMTYRIHLSEKLAVPVVQWAQVRDGRIARLEALFDASDYRELFHSDPCSTPTC